MYPRVFKIKDAKLQPRMKQIQTQQGKEEVSPIYISNVAAAYIHGTLLLSSSLLVASQEFWDIITNSNLVSPPPFLIGPIWTTPTM